MSADFILEVMLTDKNHDGHIYWVEMREGEDEDDAIDRAILFHSQTDFPPPLRLPEEEVEESFDEPAILASDPFDLEEGEYTLIPLGWGE